MKINNMDIKYFIYFISTFIISEKTNISLNTISPLKTERTTLREFIYFHNFSRSGSCRDKLRNICKHFKRNDRAHFAISAQIMQNMHLQKLKHLFKRKSKNENVYMQRIYIKFPPENSVKYINYHRKIYYILYSTFRLTLKLI